MKFGASICNVSVRTFAIGIGVGVSHHLVEGIARMGGGTVDFVTSEERLRGIVVRQLKNATQPILDDAKVKWHFPEGENRNVLLIILIQ